MKKLSDIHPEVIAENYNEWFTGFLRSLLIRTNFIINVRNKLGWRGLKPTYRNGEGWTCRINNARGIYGICFNKYFDDNVWKTGSYTLYYFPDKNEPLVGYFSLDAGLACHQADYTDLIREFLCFPEFSALFEIAQINISISVDSRALLCTLLAQEHKRSISMSGVFCEVSDTLETIIEPGGYDQNLQTYEIASKYYEVLAATLSYNLCESPAYLRQSKHINASDINLPDSDILEFALGYNKEWFNKNQQAIDIKNSNKNTTTCLWREGATIPPQFKDALFWEAHLQKSARFEKSHFDAEERPQFILLTGFLGSGKTSFLKHFIEYHTSNNRFVAVIQNEIGETGLDASMLEDNYAVLEMDEGCVCCSLIGQLKKGIQQILSNHKPDVIVLETSGLANPFNLMAELNEVRELISFESVTTIVDGQNYAASKQSSNLVINQIASANLLLLNKTDLLSETGIQSISEELQLINPNARIIETIGGDINPALLYANEDNQLISFSNHNTKMHYHTGTHNHLMEGMGSKKITFTTPLQKDEFLSKIKEIPLTVYRIKGVLKFSDSPKPVFFQSVYGHFEFSPANNRENNEYFLIFIGETTSLNKLNLIFLTN